MLRAKRGAFAWAAFGKRNVSYVRASRKRAQRDGARLEGSRGIILGKRRSKSSFMTATARRFSYIIVGAGSAGCVLAARLSEDPSVHVLLLEAGGAKRPMEVRIPAAFSKLFKGELDWNYSTQAEPHLNGRQL